MDILVIDDNTEIRENTAEILTLAGYHTVTADNGKKGVEVAIKEKPSVIVCDIMMPELDGYGVLHLVQKNPELESVPFIFLSACTEQSDIRQGMGLGANDYIIKPFTASDLQTSVENCLKKALLAKENIPEDPHGLSKLLAQSMDKEALQELASKYFNPEEFYELVVV